jgi:methylenetetrahydrofolate reductase (NADPH)
VSRLREALEAGRFVVTGEVGPPLGTDTSAMERAAGQLSPSCLALNVTDNQGATLHMSSLAGSHRLLELGLEPIFQQTCRDRNRLALQSDLLAASAMGIENLLIVTGDDPRSGDHPQAKGVFDLDSTQLLSIAKGMNEGHDMLGRELEGSTSFFLGGALFPEAEPWDIQLMKADKKVESGARFFQTQAVFDLEKLARATDAMHEAGAWVIAGILLLRSPRVVRFINEKLAGLEVPEQIAKRINGAEDAAAEAVELAIEQAAACREICDGVHIMPLGLDPAVPEIVGRAGLAS